MERRGPRPRCPRSSFEHAPWALDLNLDARAVEVYLSPDGDKYAEVRTLRAGDVLRPAALPDIAITVAEILPQA